jgi:hypothetical protein
VPVLRSPSKSAIVTNLAAPWSHSLEFGTVYSMKVCEICGEPVDQSAVPVKARWNGNAIAHHHEVAMREKLRKRGLPQPPPPEAWAHPWCVEPKTTTR